MRTWVGIGKVQLCGVSLEQTHPTSNVRPSTELSHLPSTHCSTPGPHGFPGHREAPGTEQGHVSPGCMPCPDGIWAGRNKPVQTGAHSSPVPWDNWPPAGSQFISPLCSSPSLWLSAWAALLRRASPAPPGSAQTFDPGLRTRRSSPRPGVAACAVPGTAPSGSSPWRGSTPAASLPPPTPSLLRAGEERTEPPPQGRPLPGVPFARSLDPGEPQAGRGPGGGRTGGAGGRSWERGWREQSGSCAGHTGCSWGREGGREGAPAPAHVLAAAAAPARTRLPGPVRSGWGSLWGAAGPPAPPAGEVPGCWGCPPSLAELCARSWRAQCTARLVGAGGRGYLSRFSPPSQCMFVSHLFHPLCF